MKKFGNLSFIYIFLVFVCFLKFDSLAYGNAAADFSEPNAVAQDNGTTTAMLNGLKMEFDNQTGSLLSMSYAGVGQILQADVERASLIDMAYPTKTYGPLRLASRYSRRARILAEPNHVIIILDELGNSYPKFEKVNGQVKARIDLKAMEDGKSISMQATVINDSNLPIPQILFPDFMGLMPINGKENTYFRLTRMKKRPFLDIGRARGTASPYYSNGNWWSTEFWGAHNDESCGRWFDFGGIKGGLSGYQREWGYGTPSSKLYIHHSEATPDRLRICFDNRMQSVNGDSSSLPIMILPGKTWTSSEYILTPHQGGWPKGVEPYREWVRQHPYLKIADHVKNDIGFRTVWMSEDAEFRPGEPSYFKWTDLPTLAQETLDHGMHEMVLFIATDWFALPLKPLAHLGTEEELVKAVAECKKMGVDVSPFISCVAMSDATCRRFGTTATSNAWTYHKDLIPMVNPYYAKWLMTGSVPSWRADWQKAVLDSVQEAVDKGWCTSIGWDSYQYKKPPKEENQDIHTLIRQIRQICRSKNPDAAVCSETIDNIEEDLAQLDYTWVWVDATCNCLVGNSIFKSPRFAVNIEDDGNAARRAFLQNSYISVIPRVPDGANGSGWIKNQPDLSAALKQCAKIRQQFLPYFAEGTMLGEDVVDDVYTSLPVSGFQLPDRLLVLLLNDSSITRDARLGVDLADWLPKAEKYNLQVYNGSGEKVGEKFAVATQWRTTSSQQKSSEIRIFEFTMP